MNDIFSQAVTLFKAKIATGKYKHYTEQAYELLFQDCVNQCFTMAKLK